MESLWKCHLCKNHNDSSVTNCRGIVARTGFEIKVGRHSLGGGIKVCNHFKCDKCGKGGEELFLAIDKQRFRSPNRNSVN